MKRTVMLLGLCLAAACTDAPSDTNDGGGGDELPTDTTSDSDPVTDEDSDADAEPPVSDCAVLPFPTSCDASATTAPTGYGTSGSAEVLVETMDNPRPSSPRPITVYRPDVQSKVPVIFFSHAYGATNADVYDVLFNKLASNGIAVVHSAYQSLNTTNASRYEDLWQGFTAAADAYVDHFDFTRVGFVGHSFGGGATPEMARRGYNTMGWGSAGKLMFIMAPWYSWGTDYASIPADTRTVLQIYADDTANDHAIAVNDVWNALPTTLDKVWQVVQSDACDCGLNADHVVPMSAAQSQTDGERLNGLDSWGVARRLLALTAYAFEQDEDARAIAYGDDSAMGNWLGCEGRAVKPLIAYSEPVLAACQEYQYTYAARCENADPDYDCAE